MKDPEKIEILDKYLNNTRSQKRIIFVLALVFESIKSDSMKKNITSIVLMSLFCLAPFASAEKESKERPKFSENLKVVTLTYESNRSYRDAMTKFYNRKPEGYVMEAMKEFKMKNMFVVQVKMRRP